MHKDFENSGREGTLVLKEWEDGGWGGGGGGPEPAV